MSKLEIPLRTLVLCHLGARGIATLTLNRPEKLNALSPQLFDDLAYHLDQLEQMREQLSCVVLRGAGRSFCAGADTQALRAGIVTEDPDMRSKTIARLGALSVPVLAVVQGNCLTGGLELALAADMILAAESAIFRDTHARLGIVPRWGMSARLPRRVGIAAAKRITFLSEPLTAAEALQLGLCDFVAPDSELDARAEGLAESLAKSSARSIAAVKHLYEQGASLPLEEALVYERKYTSGVYTDLGDAGG